MAFNFNVQCGSTYEFLGYIYDLRFGNGKAKRDADLAREQFIGENPHVLRVVLKLCDIQIAV
jgi:hypothetical protein